MTYQNLIALGLLAVMICLVLRAIRAINEVTMIPWGLRWNSWKWRQIWSYQYLWYKHPVVVIMAVIGLVPLLWLVAWGLGW